MMLLLFLAAVGLDAILATLVGWSATVIITIVACVILVAVTSSSAWR